jgi:NADH-quinone oxidoreductase subunit H
LEIVFIQHHSLWFIIPLFPVSILFFIAILGDSSRIPFDLPEAEAELAGGFQLEYGSTGLVFFVITEYASILFFSMLFVLLFLGGWSLNSDIIMNGDCNSKYISSSNLLNIIILSIKFGVVSSTVILIRAALPRFRVDQILAFTLKFHLIFSLISFIIISIIIIL